MAGILTQKFSHSSLDAIAPVNAAIMESLLACVILFELSRAGSDS